MAMMALVCICSNKTAVLTWHASGQVVGEDRCPIVDTYWQTETGAHVLAPIPGVWPAKPGSATLPFFGVQPAMVNEQVCTAQHSTAQQLFAFSMLVNGRGSCCLHAAHVYYVIPVCHCGSPSSVSK